MPEDPYESWPGFDFTNATNSAKLLAGTDGCSARKSGARAVSETGVKSLRAS